MLGNFVSRVTKFCRSKFGEAVPEGGAYGEAEAAALADLDARIEAYAAHMDAIEIRKAAAELRAIWVVGNEYLQAAAPWSVIKEDEARAAAIIRFSLNLVRLYGILSAPFIPDAADAILKAMRTDAAWPKSATDVSAALPAGHEFDVPDNLFAKITDDQRDEWAAKFSGVRD